MVTTTPTNYAAMGLASRPFFFFCVCVRVTNCLSFKRNKPSNGIVRTDKNASTLQLLYEDKEGKNHDACSRDSKN